MYDATREGEDCSYDRPGHYLDVAMQDSKPDGTFVSDWEFVEGLGDLDACNGTMINGTYAYLVTDTYPYVPRCLMGAFEEERHGPPPGEGGQGRPGGQGRGRPQGGERPPRGNDKQHDH